MKSSELRKKFLDFFEKNGHKIVPSSSLLTIADPSVLFTTAGMQQFVPYLSGDKDILKDFGSRHLASAQKCFRTLDIDEVGDDTHHTFFEMLGNWSIGEDKQGGYFKEGAIKLALDFFTSELLLDKDKFLITIFNGEKGIPQDEESLEIWQSQGIPKQRIIKFGMKDNFWGPTGKTGPCGPCSEIHYDRGAEYGCGKPGCGPNCASLRAYGLRCKRFVELWNLVFMEYNKNESGSYDKLPRRNVDTGIGFERLAAVLQKKDSAYETDLFSPIIQKLEEISGVEYAVDKRKFRIIADHIRGAVFLASEGVLPSNVEQGYILRRILRRAIRYGKLLNLPKSFLIPLAREVIGIYKDVYSEVKTKEADILTIIQNEEEKFGKALEYFEYHALRREIKKGKIGVAWDQGILYGNDAFYFYQAYGMPPELMKEICEEKGVKFDEKGFDEALKKHQKISRAGAEKKFGGVGKNAGEQVAKLHTATHLLHAALRNVLGSSARQMGSDITVLRLRFDFSFNRKLNPEEIKKVQDLVNQKIKKDLEIKKEEMNYKEAIKSGALAFFKEKYPEKVTVYSIGDFSDPSGQIFSKEICAGPHAARTSLLGNFKIIKEESSGAGVRRIRAVLK